MVERGRRARYVTPDLSYYWEGGRAMSCARMINGMGKQKKMVVVRANEYVARRESRRNLLRSRPGSS